METNEKLVGSFLVGVECNTNVKWRFSSFKMAAELLSKTNRTTSSVSVIRNAIHRAVKSGGRAYGFNWVVEVTND